MERVRNICVGHPLDPKIEIGPQIAQDHFEKVIRYFDIALNEGANSAAGGTLSGIADNCRPIALYPCNK